MEQDFSDEHPQLGRLVDEHPAVYQRLIKTAIGWGAAVLVFIGFLLWDTFGPNANRTSPATLALLIAVGLMIWLVFTGMAAWETGPNVKVYERGFLYGQEPFPWDEVDAFFLEKIAFGAMGLVRFNTSHTYTVRREDGKKATFSLGVDRAGELAETIQQRIQQRLLDAARREVADGGLVDFGCARLDRNSMRYKPHDGAPGEMLWTEFRDVRVDGMYVRFRKKEGWFGFALATRKVANLAVMLTLIDELVAASQIRKGTAKPKKDGGNLDW